MKKNFLKLGLFALAFGFMFNATAQCPNDNFPYLNWNLSQEGQSVSTGCLFGGEYNSLNVIEGASYEISTCESGFDTQVTIYNASTGAVVGYNDDACGLQSIVNFTASFTGTVNILLDRYNCQDEFSCGSMTATLVSLGGGPEPCDSPVTLECGSPLSYNLASGAGSYSPTDGPWGTPGNEAVFSYTPEANGSYAISVTNDNYYVDLFYQAATCEAEGWAYIDDILSSGTNSVDLTGGVTYYFLLDDENTTQSTGTIEIICPTIAVDPCDNVVVMTCDEDYNWATGAGEGLYNPPSGPWGTPGQEAVFSYTPEVDGSYLIEMTNVGYYTDIFVALSCGADADWQYIDDVFSATNITADLTGGVTYYFLLDDEDTNPSNGTLSVSCPCIPPAGGLDGSFAYDGDFVISGTTDGACNDCSLRTSQDRVYEISVPCAGTYSFSTCGASWDTYLYLTTAPCGGETIALNDDACGLQSTITAALAPGTYYVAVEAFSSFSFGEFDLAVTGTYDTPAIGAISGAGEVCAGTQGEVYTVSGDFDSFDWSTSMDATANGNGSSATVDFGNISGSVNVTASNACGTNSASINVTVNRTPEFETSSEDALCNGDDNGSITINATQGDAPFTYSINGESVTESLIVDVNASDNYIAYMNVFDNPANPCCGGGYIFGSPWLLSDVLSTLDAGANTITLQPNFNTYNAADPFWSDGNGNGNKIMEANTYLENGAWNGQDLTFSGSVVSNTIADGYSVKYFIKALNPAAGFQDALGGSATMDMPASGDFSVTVPATSLTDGLIVQVGFSVTGFNANPANADALGSVVVTGGALENGSYTFDGLTAGDYTIGLSDNNGCVAEEATVTINEPEVLTVDANGCGVVYLGAGEEYGCASIGTTVAGGTPGYAFEWSNTEVSEGITVCPTETSTYAVHVTDANGCMATTNWTVEVIDIQCTPGGSSSHSHSSKSSKSSKSGSSGSSSSHVSSVESVDPWNVQSGSGPSCSSSGSSSKSSKSSKSGSGSSSASNSGSSSSCHLSSYSSLGSAFSSSKSSKSSKSGSNSSSSELCASYGGSKSGKKRGKVLMCFDGVTYCVNAKNIDKKLNCGYSLGPCDAQQTEACNNSTATEEPVSCVCDGKIESITVRWVGPSFSSANVHAKKNCNILLASLTDLMTGDEFTINASDAGLAYLRKDTYFEWAGVNRYKIPTNCCDNPVGQNFFPFEVIGWTDTEGNTCSVNSQASADAGTNDKEMITGFDGAMIKQYPNPANQNATFEFSVTEDQNVSVNILNINGQVVGSIYNGSVRANEVNKLDYNVTTLQSGIYYVHLNTPSGVLKKKFVIIK